MTQYNDLVERRRLYLKAEEWGQGVKQHYVCKGGIGDLGYGMGYFVYYNNGEVRKINKSGYDVVRLADPIEIVMDNYVRSSK